MIIYFSGTGNSKYAATLLGNKLDEETKFLPMHKEITITSVLQRLIFVFPIYSWGVPPIVLNYIDRLNSEDCRILKDIPIFMVCTCGDETALAPEMFEKKLNEKGLTLQGGWSVIMPNNYVLLPGFNVDSEKLESEKLDKVPSRITYIAGKIKDNSKEMDYTRGSLARLKTGLVYPLFKKWGIFPSKWHWTPECVRCGKCVKVCPVNNVTFKGGHPTWGKACVSCLACFHICPVHAVEYGNMTKNKGQYFCRKK